MPNIYNYNATDQLFIHSSKKRFDRIVDKDHFVDHLSQKYHP